MKKGFTLIELLAVIVILAIIALIAVPIILNIIEDVNESAFKETINGILRQTEISSTFEEITDEKLYKYENNEWVESELKINGTHPKYIEVKVNKKGKTRYAITDGKYCALKEYDGKVEVKKVPEDIKEEYCKLDASLPTNEACFKYTVSNNEVRITDYYDYEGNDSSKNACPRDVIIPEEIEGYKVTKIGYRTFYYNKLTSVIIPSSVTSIGQEAFSYNELTSVEIPSSVTSIDNSAFSYNKLASVIIPNSVTSLGYWVFSNNQLTNVQISNNLTTLSLGTFFNNQLTSVEIPSSVTSIEGRAFSHNQLTSITIPEEVTSIGGGAFTNNQLPDDQAFIYNRKSDGSIDYTTLNSYGGVKRDNIVISSEVNGIKLLKIENYAFYDNDITSIEIPNSVTSISHNAFCSNKLTSVTLPKSLTSIENDSFSYNQLTSVIIPEGVTKIGTYAFYDNDITSIEIPSSVKSIGNRAFHSNKLTSLIIPEGTTSIDYRAFYGNQLTNISIPSSVISISSEAFNNNQLPDDQAFIYGRNSDGSINYTKIIGYGGAKRSNVVIPEEVNGIKLLTIGDSAFKSNNLGSVTIPNSVISIESDAFRSNLLNSITIPSSVTSIGSYAFRYNYIKSVKIIGKSSISDFTSYPTSSPFDWTSGYSDSNIEWINE